MSIQQSNFLGGKFMAEVSIYDARMLLWLDESGLIKEMLFVSMVTVFVSFLCVITVF